MDQSSSMVRGEQVGVGAAAAGRSGAAGQPDREVDRYSVVPAAGAGAGAVQHHHQRAGDRRAQHPGRVGEERLPVAAAGTRRRDREGGRVRPAGGGRVVRRIVVGVPVLAWLDRIRRGQVVGRGGVRVGRLGLAVAGQHCGQVGHRGVGLPGGRVRAGQQPIHRR
jgi:hypothetical protein